MKKFSIGLFVIGMFLACSTPVFAATETTVFQPEPWAAIVQGGIHATAQGYVTVQNTVVTVQLWHAAPRYEYVVKSNGKVLGTFTTDKIGYGILKLKVSAPAKTLGRWINIWQTAGLRDGSYWGDDTHDYSDWYGHVASQTETDFDGLGLFYGQRY